MAHHCERCSDTKFLDLLLALALLALVGAAAIHVSLFFEDPKPSVMAGRRQ